MEKLLRYDIPAFMTFKISMQGIFDVVLKAIFEQMDVAKSHLKKPDVLGLKFWLSSEVLAKLGSGGPADPACPKAMWTSRPRFFNLSKQVRGYIFTKYIL